MVLAVSMVRLYFFETHCNDATKLIRLYEFVIVFRRTIIVSYTLIFALAVLARQF